MAVHWNIPFRTLRSGYQLTASIYDSSGASAVTLTGAAMPFETQEDNDEDMFVSMRTQSGYLRIVDTNSVWSSIIPSKDTDRYIRLTYGGTILWQGFLQAQTFGNRLYNGTQEIELPVQCLLSVLSTQRPSTSDAQPRNFAYIINMCVSAIEGFCSAVGASSPITNIYVQGGSHATEWLLKKIDWQNFFSSDENEDMTAKYTYREMLEDMCQYWGWTVRIYRQSLIFSMVDDTGETGFLNLTRANLTTLAGGSDPSAGSASYSTVAMPGTLFSSIENDEYIVRGPNKAVVKADSNEASNLFQVLPPSVQNAIDNDGSMPYTWHGLDGSTTVGYFSTPTFLSFGSSTYPSKIIQGTATSGNGFARRQYYTSEETDNAIKADVIILTGYSQSTAKASIQTKKQMNLSQGSLRLTADVFCNSSQEGELNIFYRLGIGQSRASAKWLYARIEDTGSSVTTEVDWMNSDQYGSWVRTNNGTLSGSFTVESVRRGLTISYPLIPLESGLQGYIFIDFFGATNMSSDPANVEIGNLSIEYNRDTIYINSAGRSRTMDPKRESSRTYTASNNSTAVNEWNANLIFSSDQNMRYGYGLLMNPNGTFMSSVTYGAGSSIPEQHLANRVADYWDIARRMLTVNLRSNETIGGISVRDLSPLNKVTFGGLTYYPISINHNWRDDITTVTLMQI